jgi:hypothetical protein
MFERQMGHGMNSILNVADGPVVLATGRQIFIYFAKDAGLDPNQSATAILLPAARLGHRRRSPITKYGT